MPARFHNLICQFFIFFPRHAAEQASGLERKPRSVAVRGAAAAEPFE
jgi:hypothetical protein